MVRSGSRVDVSELTSLAPFADGMLCFPATPDYAQLVEGEELARLIAESHVLGVRSRTKIRAEQLAHASRLLAIGCFSVGTDQVDVCHLPQRVDPGVRATGGMDRRQLASHAMDCLFEPLLNRRPMVLTLPAHERPPVELDRQPPTRHGSIVPFGIAKPRSSSSTVIALRPAR